jgi:GTPase SAR1 family protein
MTNRYAQIVMGPAGSGKSSYIRRLLDHFEHCHRTVFAVNLDPAADDLFYTAAIDVREAVSVREAMDSHGFGPNGGLIFCMEQIVTEFDWFDEVVGEHNYDYLLIDLPGQIELFSHLNILPRLFSHLERKGYNLCAVFLMDSQFMCDRAKFLSGCLVALSAMTMLEMPHVNLLSKCDLLSEEQREELDSFVFADTMALAGGVSKDPGVQRLTARVCEVIEKFSLLEFIPFDPTDNDEVRDVVAKIDMILQFYEEADYHDPEFDGGKADSNSGDDDRPDHDDDDDREDL